MNTIKFKVFFAFFSLLFLIIFISSIEFNNAFQTYKENKDLQTETEEISITAFKLENLSFKINYIGRQHIQTDDPIKIDYYNQEISVIHNELKYLIEKLLPNMLQHQTYSNLYNQWVDYLEEFDAAIAYSNENNNEKAQKTFLGADKEFNNFITEYIQPLASLGYQHASNLVNTQNENFEMYLWLRILLFLVTIAIFFVIFYYLQKTLKKSEFYRKKLEYLAFHDELTGLPNRRMFEKQVTEVINDSNEEFALMFLDMDKLKIINDNFGHDMGDLVIVEFANRVKKIIRDNDIFARQGGDEFTILLQEVDEAKIRLIAETIIQSFESPIMINEQKFSISTSIGIALFPRNGTDYLTLLKFADESLYEAKKTRNTFKFMAI